MGCADFQDGWEVVKKRCLQQQEVCDGVTLEVPQSLAREIYLQKEIKTRSDTFHQLPLPPPDPKETEKAGWSADGRPAPRPGQRQLLELPAAPREVQTLQAT